MRYMYVLQWRRLKLIKHPGNCILLFAGEEKLALGFFWPAFWPNEDDFVSLVLI